MDSTFTNNLQKMLEAAEHQLKDILSKRTAIQVEEIKLTKKINALKVLLNDEGKSAIHTVPQSNPPAPSPSIKPDQSIFQFVYSFIATKNGAGTTHKEIAEALTAGGYTYHRNYPYVVVSKLKQDGKAIEKDGKLFWKQGA